jgi:hypothetical protein
MGAKTIVMQMVGLLSTTYNRRKMFDVRSSVEVTGDLVDTEMVLSASENSGPITVTKFIVARVEGAGITCALTVGLNTTTLEIDDIMVITAPLTAVFTNTSSADLRIRLLKS